MINLNDIRQATTKLRFTRGMSMVGPEYAGCCGTGVRPTILRCPYSQIKEPLFLVGPELCIDEHKRTIALNHLAGHPQRIYGKDNSTVYVFKTKHTAIEKFLELCGKVLEYNESERTEVALLREQARKGDMAAALSLGLDH